MSEFSKRLRQQREQLSYSQSRLAKEVGVHHSIIGRYEREEIKPSIDVAAKIADALNVTLDYLLGKSNEMVLDKKNLQRLSDIEQLPEDDKKHIFYAIDGLIKAAILKSIAAL
jgi:transcriptional regulator with XRE-family HTH domain